MPVSFQNLIERTWQRYRNSFDADTIIASCRPIAAIVPVVVWVGIILVFRFVPEANNLVGLQNALIPSIITLLAGVGSVCSWVFGRKSKELLAAFQLVENTLWGGAFIATAAFSNTTSGYFFCGLFSLCCLYWGTQFSFTLFGIIPLLISPLGFFLAGRIDVFALAISVVGFLLFFSAGRLTSQRRHNLVLTTRSEDVLNRLESMFVSCRAGATADLQTQIGSLAHQLRNNLYFADDYIDELRENTVSGSKEDELSSNSQDSIRQTVKLLENFLKGFGKGSENPSFQLSYLASSVEIDEHDSLGNILNWGELPDVWINGQESMVGLSIRSLIDNAAEANARSVTVDGELVDNNWLLLKIADDGPGLPDEVRKNLFKPYNTYGKSHGVGLGIYLAAQIVRGAGGSIALAETGSSGTCFHMKLPLAAPGEDTECESQPAAVPPSVAIV